jgi:hypothetical protein
VSRRANLAAVASLAIASLAISTFGLSRAGVAQDDGEKPGQPKLFRDWTGTPDAVIVFSGQQHGYLEPCGCSPQFQKGGLARRLAFINSLRDKKWPIAAVDLGGILEDNTQQKAPGQYPISQQQAFAKIEIALESLQHMGYDVVNFSPEELGVPNGYAGLMGALININNPPQPRLLNTNLEMKDQVWLQEGLLVRSVTRQVGKLKISFFGAVGESHKDRVNDPEINRWQSPDAAIAPALAKLKRESDLQVLLLTTGVAEAKRLAQKFPDIDDIIHGDEAEEPSGRAEWVGNTMLVTIGAKGKYSGAVGIYNSKARFELVPLDNRFDEDKHIRELLDKKYIDKLNELQLVQNAPRLPHPNGPKLTFVGSEACKICHPNVVAKWSSTRHAHALETLVNGVEHNGKKIAGGKQANPECINCHVTGFGYVSGYDGTDKTKHLYGNGCENCHGPASEHVRVFQDPNANKEDLQRARRSVRLNTQTEERNLCVRCHDAENDPAFSNNFDNRWADVEHGEEAGKDQELWPKIRELLSKKPQ